MFSDIFLFRSLSPAIMFELYFASEVFPVMSGQVIIHSGEKSETFYIIEEGLVDVYKGKELTSDNIVTTLQRGDIFGENALRRAKHIPRTATIVARNNGTLLAIRSELFKNILNRDGESNEMHIDSDISRMDRMRPFVQEVLSRTYLFQNLTPDQVNYIAALLEKQNIYSKDSYIIHEGGTDSSLFVIEKGNVRLVRLCDDGEHREFMQMGVGSIFGELSLITGLPRTCSVIANEDCVILELTKEAFDKLTNQYQNLRVKIAQLVEQRLRENQKVTKEILTPRSAKKSPPGIPLLKVSNIDNIVQD